MLVANFRPGSNIGRVLMNKPQVLDWGCEFYFNKKKPPGHLSLKVLKVRKISYRSIIKMGILDFGALSSGCLTIPAHPVALANVYPGVVGSSSY